MLPEFRGQGCAVELVGAAEDVARELGAEVMRLHAQLQIVEFCNKLGYVTVGGCGYAGEDHSCIVMEKRLLATDNVAV